MANANNSILFKKGTYANFEKNVLGIDGTKNIEAGALYLTTDEGGLYLGLDADNVKRIQGSVLIYDSAQDLLQKVKPPYDPDVIYFIASSNQLVRYDGQDWVVLNRTKQDLDAALAGLQGSIDQVASDLAVITPIANDALSKTNGGEVKGNTTFSGKLYANTTPTADKEVANKEYVDDKASALTGESTDVVGAITIHGALKAAAEAKGLANAAQETADGALSRSAGGTVSGETTFSGKLYVNTTPTTGNEATNKTYVDGKASTLLGNNNSAAGSDTIKGALKSAAAADEKAEAASVAASVADGKAVAAQSTADSALEKANDAQAAADKAQVTADGAVTGVGEAKTAASAAQTTANEAKTKAEAAAAAAATADGKAVAAQSTADSALEKANDALSKSKGGIVSGATTFNGTTQVSKTPSAGNDITNKTYVDGKASALLGTTSDKAGSTTIHGALKSASDAATAAATADGKAVAAQSTADGALSRSAGGTVSGATTFTGSVSLKTATISTTPSANTDVTNKSYVDSAISSAIANNDAMTFKGVISKVADLPTSSANKGDTYKVGVAGTYATYACKIGDLLINSGEDGATPQWVHVPSGNEDVVSQALLHDTATNSIFLNDGVNTTYGDMATKLGALKFVSNNDNLSLNIASSNKVHTITASMTWGSF